MADRDSAHYEKETSLGRRLLPHPKGINPKRGTRQYRQVRALTALLLIITASTLFWSIVLGIDYLFFNKAVRMNVIIALVVLAMLLVEVWCYYRFANVRLSAAFMTMSYFFMVAGLVLMSGGFDSPLLVMLISSPIISYRIGGRDEGIMNSVFVAMFGLFLLYAKYQEFVLPNYLGGLDSMMASGIAWLATLTIVSASLASYDIDE